MRFIFLVTWIRTGNNEHLSGVGPHLLPDLHAKRITSDSKKETIYLIMLPLPLMYFMIPGLNSYFH
jgi:hypothetical protein